jgi:hypothetical protein
MRHPDYPELELVHPDDDEENFTEKRTRTSTRDYRTRAAVKQDDPLNTVTRARSREVQRYQGYDEVNVHVRKKHPQPHATTQQARAQDEHVLPTQRARRWPFRFVVVLTIIVTLVLVILVVNVCNWWNIYQDDLHYGRPRTFQIDAVVGHHDSASHPSHFIILNLHRHVEIIELQGGDASKTKIYTGPVLLGDGQELTPVTVSFKDVNGDGKPEMIVRIQDQEIDFINDGTQFKSSVS